MADGSFAGGNGTKDNPYLIEDAFDLDAVRNNLKSHYRLIKNIDLNIDPFNKGWTPIGQTGTGYTSFEGTLDGYSHVVSNLIINQSKLNRVGLFARIDNSLVENLGIQDANVVGDTYVGILAGHAESSTIKNCITTGVLSGNSDIGGLLGSVGASSFIDKCLTMSVIEIGEKTGGLIGTSWRKSSSVTNSFWDKEISGEVNSVGGVGLTTEEMKNPQTFIDAGWEHELNEDGEKVWILKNGEYPRLRFDTKDKTLFLNNNKYYKYKDKQWKEVSSSLPSTDQFKEHGMEDLSVFNRNVQPITNNPFNMTSEETDEGKLFKTKVDLKKFFDLRSLKIK